VVIGGQEDHVLDLPREKAQQPPALRRIALPAVIGQDVVLLDSSLVHDDFEASLRLADGGRETLVLRVAEEVAIGIAHGVQTLLGHRLGQ
jgi:hypothetical protein